MNSKQLSIILIITFISPSILQCSDEQTNEQLTLEQRAALLLTNVDATDRPDTGNNPPEVTDEAVERELELLSDECDFLISYGLLNHLSRKDIRELTEIRHNGGDWKNKLGEKRR